MFEVRKFAEGLRAAVEAMDPIVGDLHDLDIPPKLSDCDACSPWGLTRFNDLVRVVGYERAKQVPEVRRLLQAAGTEAGRLIHGEDCWVDYLMPRIVRDSVITDVRFDNEAMAILERGGFIVEVTRDGLTRMDHASEAGLSPQYVRYAIRNRGSIYDLQKQLIALVDREWPQ